MLLFFGSHFPFLQSILGLLRHHQAMAFCEEALKKEAAEWNKAMEISTSTATEKAKLHDKITKELKNAVLDAVQKTKKETDRADEAERAVKALQESLRIANLGVSEAKKKPLRALKETRLPFKRKRLISSRRWISLDPSSQC